MHCQWRGMRCRCLQGETQGGELRVQLDSLQTRNPYTHTQHKTDKHNTVSNQILQQRKQSRKQHWPNSLPHLTTGLGCGPNTMTLFAETTTLLRTQLMPLLFLSGLASVKIFSTISSLNI